jgi:hypothetical protein
MRKVRFSEFPAISSSILAALLLFAILEMTARLQLEMTLPVFPPGASAAAILLYQ